MIIVPKYAVFYHVPKTGGSFVNQVVMDTCEREGLAYRLIKNNQRHATPGQVLIGHEQPPMDLPTFCVFRRPVSWYESWWRYMCKPHTRWSRIKNSDHHPFQPLYKCWDTDFPAFIEKVLELECGYLGKLYARYQCDVVASTEHLRKQLALFGRQVGLDLRTGIPAVNVTPTARPTWKEGHRRRINQCETEAIDACAYATSRLATISLD